MCIILDKMCSTIKIAAMNNFDLVEVSELYESRVEVRDLKVELASIKAKNKKWEVKFGSLQAENNRLRKLLAEIGEDGYIRLIKT